jgi:undecaprenyl-diphosphatase
MFNWFMARKRLDACARISRWVSRSGDGPLYLVVGLCLYASPFESGEVFFYCALSAFLFERCLYLALKNGFRRGRPQEALPNFRSFVIPSDRFSFPSGHTSAAFLMATLLGFFFPSLMWAAYIWASLVGLSRIFLGVHFPTDVLVGMTMGITVAAISFRILNL